MPGVDFTFVPLPRTGPVGSPKLGHIFTLTPRDTDLGGMVLRRPEAGERSRAFGLREKTQGLPGSGLCSPASIFRGAQLVYSGWGLQIENWVWQ